METRKTNFLGENPEKPQKPVRNKKSRFLLYFSIFLIIFISACIVKSVTKPNTPNDPSAYDPITLEPKKPASLLKKIKDLVFSKDIALEGQKNDRINILLLGMGGLGHDGPFLTDTIIIASIKPSTSQVSMISIPRDLGVQIPEYGFKKINSANAFGEVKKTDSGGEFASKIISNTFGIDIHYYVRVDFQAFQDVIEEVDGIKVNVDTTFTDTEYPADNYEYQTVHFDKGINDMNGEDALQYARSRHGNNGEGSDFARAKRQQKMILALKEKVISFETLANPIRIHNIIKTLDKHIITNMEFSDIISMLKLSKTLNTNNINTVVLNNGVGGYLQNTRSDDGAFILEPTSGSFEEINKIIKSIFDHENPEKIPDNTPNQETPEVTITNIEIQNGTWQAGLAARAQKKLSEDNFLVTSVGNTTERPMLESGIYSLTNKGKEDVLPALKEVLNIPIKKDLPKSEKFAHGSDILIILGENFDYSSI
ncbi:MAG: hypothetical protein COX81_03520 [Candidatus Magasanikbacteria bacterium CG_4_10_14_0_2_um_filter_37_12]|uniref:Cell envelope-related transcriptional attenuator domain-containing protein n=1 Tax=Candidatus Magasanikbacteria bacterium CG_4_10_14_0_2_um_filter_37_12 TaxID=1974637 RepID=A0A2M7V705_9BACT|nr:MAG: hypothetical protein COX81_03520 [Candidatus Magasanikbacteria bacterium CG_4_10_14_0_2_um_filter_37_12]